MTPCLTPCLTPCRLLDALADPAATTEADLHRLTDAALPADHSARASLSTRALRDLLAAPGPLAAATWPEEAVVLHTHLGRVWIGSPGDDIFDAPYLAVLDPGGRDLYRGDGLPQAFSAILDLDGDDTHRSPPTAHGGIALLVDMRGDDTYVGESGSLGAGLWGCGVVVDRGGDDTYRAGPWSAGAGLAGVGLLLDGHGDDLYSTDAPSQGLGGPLGIGALVDGAGHDTYDARGDAGSQGSSLGPGPWLAGGLGLLDDGGGDDLYRAGAWSQGSARYGGVGILLDSSGDDGFSCSDHCQASAAHDGIALLTEGAGDDVYVAGRHAQAAAHDRSAAVLWDLSGSDRLQASTHAQAHASAGALAMVWNVHGDDAYHALDPDHRWGCADSARGEPTFAVLLDRDGSDTYGPDTDHADGRALPASRHGLALDHRVGPASTFGATAAQTIPAPAAEAEVPELIARAARWAEDPDGADAARDRLAAAGPGIYPVLRDHLHADHPHTAIALEAVLLQMASTDGAWADALGLAVTADLSSGIDDGTAAHLLVWAGGLPGDVGPVARDYLGSTVPDVRRAAAAVLEPQCDATAAEALEAVLADDDVPTVRAAAARSLGGCASPEAVAALATSLADARLAVRDAASSSLVDLSRVGLRSSVQQAIRPAVTDGNVAALEVAVRVPDSANLPALEILLTHPEAGVRAHASLALGAIGGHAARKALMGREAVEADAYVLWCLDRALRTPGNGAAMVPELD